VTGKSLRCGAKLLSLNTPVIMGVLNVTPDSFSDGGQYTHIDQALQHARSMVEQGAAIIDIGGESTRPGAAEVSSEDEIQRVVPVIEAITQQLDTVVSVDTSKPRVMQAAVAAGAGLINDVRALREPGALEMAASLNVPVCLMHMQGQPRTMQQSPQYDDVLADVLAFLQQRVEACLEMGIAREQLLIDPGFGFGKSLQHNLSLLKHLPAFLELQLPLLVGMSRKSMLGMILDKEVDERLYGSLALAALSSWLGADIIRVHDVEASMDVIRVVDAVRKAK
jgi:dihydropteroate synthase